MERKFFMRSPYHKPGSVIFKIYSVPMICLAKRSGKQIIGISFMDLKEPKLLEITFARLCHCKKTGFL